MKSVLCFLFVCLLFACQAPEVEPINNEGKPVPEDPASQSSSSFQPATPAKNCEVYVTNRSRNPYAHVHLFLNGKSSSDLVGICGLQVGSTTSLCIEPGTHQLYAFTNMYQFSAPITITVPESGKLELSVRSGP